MDRPINIWDRRKRFLRRALPPVIGVLLVVFTVIAIAGWIRPSVKREEIRTGVVDRGSIEATITASGNVVPEYEHVITSPIETRVTRILKRPGDELKAGEAIVELDAGESRLVLDKLNDRIALKKIERKEAKQNLDGKINEWSGQCDIKELELRSLEYETKRCRENPNLFSGDDLRKAENDAERARIELRQIQATMELATRRLKTELERMDLEIGILQKEKDEAEHRLLLATPSSDRAGVLTWVVPSEGAAVRRGDEIARVADLSAFRVEATISDVHAPRVFSGQPVIVRIGDLKLRGRVIHVLPTVENGVVTLEVSLDDKRHTALRHNLRVEVYIVTSSEENALLVPRGQFPTVDGVPMVFVVRGDKAERTEVRFGLKSFEKYQILDGLLEGDEVILTDMRDHQHAGEVGLR